MRYIRVRGLVLGKSVSIVPLRDPLIMPKPPKRQTVCSENFYHWLGFVCYIG